MFRSMQWIPLAWASGGELKCLSLIFAEDPAVLIIVPVSGKAAVMCQHTVNFKEGVESPPSC